MTREQILALPNVAILELAQRLRVGYRLKRTMRYATKRDQTAHNESVAEHKFALHYLNYFFLPLEDPARRLDPLRIGRMLTFHDFGEIPNGDVPYHLKTPAHEEQERRDAQKVFELLPGHLADEARLGWSEYEIRDTPEARYAYALDKVEPSFELFDPVNERTFKRIRHTYEDHIGKKLAATEHFPVMRRFVEALGEDMLDRDVFWRRPRAPALAT